MSTWLRELVPLFPVDLESTLGRYAFLLLDQTPDLVWLSMGFTILILLSSWFYTKWSRSSILAARVGFQAEDVSQYLDEDSDEVSQPQRNMMSRLKIARQKAMDEAIDKKLSPDERLKEKRTENEQLEKIFSLLHQNELDHGPMSMEDLKKQMSMYKAN